MTSKLERSMCREKKARPKSNERHAHGLSDPRSVFRQDDPEWPLVSQNSNEQCQVDYLVMSK